MSLSLSRRNLLKALGLGSIAALPVFRPGRTLAEVTSVPKRFVALKYNNGTRFSEWFPSGSGTEVPLGTLPRLLQPFEAVKSKLLVLKGLRLSASIGPGGSHNAGMSTLLTGVEVPTDETGKRMFQFAGGISVDQHIANVIGNSTKFASLQFGIQAGNRTISHKAKMEPLIMESDPFLAFDRIFGELASKMGMDDGELAKLRARRASVLDHNAKELTSLSAALGGNDRQRVELHLDSIRQLEKSLETTVSAACEAPTLPPAPADIKTYLGADENVPAISRLQLDLLALSLSCDLTRVATLSWGWGAHAWTFPWLGVDMGLHGLSHLSSSDPLYPGYLQALDWFSEEIAYLLAKLDSIVESDGQTLLDHSVVMVGSDNGEGRSHTINNIPFLLAGSAGGALKTGRFIEYPELTPHNGLLISLCNVMGAPVESFGNPAHCNGPLPGLTA